MTYASDLGFKVGDKFRVKEGSGHSCWVAAGELVTFSRDDGSDCPEFTREDGETFFEEFDCLEYIGETMPATFKEGDKVRIVKKFKATQHCNWQPRMDECIGMQGEVGHQSGHSGAYAVTFNKGEINEELWFFYPESFELVGEVPKFKEGDKVLIKNRGSSDSSCWVSDMNETVGQTGTIKSANDKTCFVRVTDFAWWYPNETLELIKEPPTATSGAEKTISPAELMSKIEDSVAQAPTGIRSRVELDKERALEILEAMHRYISVDEAVPVDWIFELDALIGGWL